MNVWRAVLAGIVAGLAVASPASAHSQDAPGASDYRTTVTAITPALPGLTIRTVDAGASLELRYTGPATIEVLGYSGEPYLSVSPGGVRQNAQSPATYLNETLHGGAEGGDAAAAPEWRQLSSTPVVRWHDHRAHWMGPQPPIAARQPDRPHRLREWSIPLRDGVRDFRVTGTLDWAPRPEAWGWWAGVVVIGLGVALLGGWRVSAGAAQVAGPAGGATLAAARRFGPVVLAVVAGGLSLVDSAGRVLDAGTFQREDLWGFAAGAGMLAAAGYALPRRPAADFALGLAGGALALLCGFARAAVFQHAIAPVPWDGLWARFSVAACVGVGLGLAAAAGHRIGRVGPAGRAAPVA
ncbi:hypothetical protein Lfu02_13900 [Longispora fulva]|uniref:Uncharacterized protein n=1 Tax=Longispora fulva TaxID=619741 RepID=A0A8J7GVY4_9ACTN|nr:hypothetical protein [Longispora fulva]MBG6140600.1 hypothetical protein [Longispora fulva]GIG57018.1 hypothetical protein Lfu02_13900 [Longispora fulva]